MAIPLIDMSTLQGTRSPMRDYWTALGPPEVLAQMPENHRDQILFLDAPSTSAVYDVVNRRNLLCSDEGWGNRPFNKGCFNKVIRYEMQGEAEVKQWLHHRGIPFAAHVLLLPVFDEPAILTTWKIVVKYSSQIFCRDNIVIVGENIEWCLYYHHSDTITFASEPNIAKFRW